MLVRYLFAGWVAFGLAASARAAGVAEHVVVIVWDGLRPDCVTPELTPTLWQLRTNGVWFARHHPVYPSITEANGTALATGAYPRRSDVLGDTEYRPVFYTNRPIGMENLGAIREIEARGHGRFLGAPTVAEVLQQRGLRTAVAGTKTVALLLDRAERSDNDPLGRVLFANATLPSSLWSQLTNRFGPPPAARIPNTARDEWTARCLITGLWSNAVPSFSMLWMSDPDTTQHRLGVGSPRDLEAIRGLDRNLSLVLGELDRRGVRAKTDVMVVSDHGFSTVMRAADTAATLRRAGLNAQRRFSGPPAEGDVLVVGNAGSAFIYVIGHQPAVVQKAVTALQSDPFAGTIFTQTGLPGTFPLSEARLDSPDAPDIVLSLRWQSGQYTNRLPGLIYEDGTGRGSGHGTHATLSPTDMHNTCIASGPDFRAGVTNTVASGNVDIAPTVLWLLGVQPPDPMDGRVLSEALAPATAPPPRIEQRKIEAHTDVPEGEWSQYLSFTEVNGVRYLDEGNGQFTPETVTHPAPERSGNP